MIKDKAKDLASEAMNEYEAQEAKVREIITRAHNGSDEAWEQLAPAISTLRRIAMNNKGNEQIQEKFHVLMNEIISEFEMLNEFKEMILANKN